MAKSNAKKDVKKDAVKNIKKTQKQSPASKNKTAHQNKKTNTGKSKIHKRNPRLNLFA